MFSSASIAEFFDMKWLMCCARTKTLPPPPELVGSWFLSAYSLEKRLGMQAGRREYQLPQPDEGKFAWAIIDQDLRSLEYCVGQVHKGKTVSQITHRMEVQDWFALTWRGAKAEDVPLLMGGRGYSKANGQKVLTSIMIQGIPLHRAFPLKLLNSEPILVLLSEARHHGWDSVCLASLACVIEEHARSSAASDSTVTLARWLIPAYSESSLDRLGADALMKQDSTLDSLVEEEDEEEDPVYSSMLRQGPYQQEG